MAKIFNRGFRDFAPPLTVGGIISFGDPAREERCGDDDKFFILEGRLIKASCDEGTRTVSERRRLLISEPLQIVLGCRGKYEWAENKKPGILIQQIGNDQFALRLHGQFNVDEPAIAINGQRYGAVFGVLLDEVRSRKPKIITDRHFAIAVDRHVTYFGNNIPFLKRVICAVAIGLRNHDAIDAFW